MKDMQKLKSEYEGLVKRLNNIEEVGCFELRKVIEELKDLTSRVSLTYTTVNMDATISNYDKANSADIFRELDEKAKTQLTLAEYIYSARRRLLNYAYAQYLTIKNLKKENLKRLKEYESDLDQTKAVLIHISDPFAHKKFEEAIALFDKHVNDANNLNKSYDEVLERLESDCRVLLDGGRLSTKDFVDEEEILDEINRDISTRIASPVVESSAGLEDEEGAKELRFTVEKVENNETVEDKNPSIIPFASFERRSSENKDLNREETTKLNEILDGGKKEEVPERVASKETVVDEEIEVPKKETEEDVIKPPKKEEEKDTATEETKEEEKPTKMAPPPRRASVAKEEVEEEKTKEEEETVEEDEKPVGEIEREDRAFRAVIKQPKSTLWKKVGKAVEKAVFFLSLIATAFHTGVIAKNTTKEVEANNKEEIHEETEAEEKDLNIGIETTDNATLQETDVDVPVIGDVQKANLNPEEEVTQGQGTTDLSDAEDFEKFLTDINIRKM